MQNRGGNATRHWHSAAATTLTGSLRRFVTGDPATAALGGERTFAGLSRNEEDAPKPAVPLIQTRMRVSPDCFPSSRPGRDRERGAAMIYAGRFILYRDRW